MYVCWHPEGVRATAASKIRSELTEGGSWVVCADLRGMDSTYATQAAYVGIRDQPLCVGAMKLGETVAGWWTDDLLAVVGAARTIAGAKVESSSADGAKPGWSQSWPRAGPGLSMPSRPGAAGLVPFSCGVRLSVHLWRCRRTQCQAGRLREHDALYSLGPDCG